MQNPLLRKSLYVLVGYEAVSRQRKWVGNRFGKRLYSTFFKAYTEKVWGIPCNEISADWAAQRIQGLSLFTALKQALLEKQTDKKGEVIKTLIDQFQYPRLGPGMMWEKVADIVDNNGGEVQLETEVEKIIWRADRVTSLQVRKGDETRIVEGSHFISSMPVRELIQRLEPSVPQHVLDAANDLQYRDFLIVALIVDQSEMFPDNWIYIHDPDVQVGRIQNFKNWSPDMVCDPGKTCLGLEYFCYEGDGLWAMRDEELIELGKRELEQLSLLSGSKVEDASVVRMHKAYPVYNASYLQSLETVKNFLSPIANIQLVGRNGMHKYNNQDHSMLTAMLAVENILGTAHNIWKVNTDGEYHEEVTRGSQEAELKDIALTQPRVPERVSVREQVK